MDGNRLPNKKTTNNYNDMTITLTINDDEVKELLRQIIRDGRQADIAVNAKDDEQRVAMQTRRVLVEDLPLPTRAINALTCNDINTLEKLLRCSEGFLLRMRDMGPGTIKEICKYLEHEGYRLGMLPPFWVYRSTYSYEAYASDRTTRSFGSDKEVNDFIEKENYRIFGE